MKTGYYFVEVGADKLLVPLFLVNINGEMWSYYGKWKKWSTSKITPIQPGPQSETLLIKTIAAVILIVVLAVVNHSVKSWECKNIIKAGDVGACVFDPLAASSSSATNITDWKNHQ